MKMVGGSLWLETNKSFPLNWNCCPPIWCEKGSILARLVLYSMSACTDCFLFPPALPIRPSGHSYRFFVFFTDFVCLYRNKSSKFTDFENIFPWLSLYIQILSPKYRFLFHFYIHFHTEQCSRSQVVRWWEAMCYPNECYESILNVIVTI